MNMSLITMGGKYGAIDTDDSSCHGYYIIKFFSYPYTLQADLIIDGKVISSDEMVCEGTNFFTININYHYYVLQRTKSTVTIVSLRKIIHVNVNAIWYDSKCVLPPFLRSISQNDYNNFHPYIFPRMNMIILWVKIIK